MGGREDFSLSATGRRPPRRLPGSRILAIALLAAVAASCSSAPPARRSAILIVVDSLRADRLGAYGHSRPTSPNLDAWAREGRLYERAYSTSTWTLPAFASLYTGLLPARHGAGMAGFDRPDAVAANRLGSGVATIAETLSARGLATGAVVNNPLLEPAFGLDRGFRAYDHPRNGGRDARRADEIVDRALASIDGWRGQPFFLVVHFVDPHLDYDAPPSFRGRFTRETPSTLTLPVGDLAGLRQGSETLPAGDRAFIAAAYDEEIAFVDDQVGRLRSGLATRGLLGPTLIVLTADHGEELFEHGGFEHGHAMWEQVLRVPLIVWGPDVRVGREAAAVSLADVTPTLLEGLGASRPPGSLDGISLWPNLTGGAAVPERTLFAQGLLYGPPQSAVVRWPLKVVADADLHPLRAHDLEADPGEQRDLAGRAPQAVMRLVADLRAHSPGASRAPSAGAAPPPDPAVLDRLRSLGYIR